MFTQSCFIVAEWLGRFYTLSGRQQIFSEFVSWFFVCLFSSLLFWLFGCFWFVFLVFFCSVAGSIFLPFYFKLYESAILDTRELV